jgi:hypothetical protein
LLDSADKGYGMDALVVLCVTDSPWARRHTTAAI